MKNDELRMTREAVKVLLAGGVIAFPTETTYGLGCDPRNKKAVARIFKMKGRDKKKRLLLVAASEAQVRKVAHLAGKDLKLARRHWPGPLTLVLPVKAGKGDVAVRVSSSNLVQGLTKTFGFPIIATSANRSGEPDARSARAIRRAFTRQKERPDFILDGGALPRRKPSTVARVKDDGSIEVLRQGAIRL